MSASYIYYACMGRSSLEAPTKESLVFRQLGEKVLKFIIMLFIINFREFVRPSYGSERTWGTVTSSYGGVGSACQLFKKRGRGSISRSHRHYGSGCIN